MPGRYTQFSANRREIWPFGLWSLWRFGDKFRARPADRKVES